MEVAPDSTPMSVRIGPASYMRLLAVVHELERVQGRRVSLCDAFTYVLDEYEEQQIQLEAMNALANERAEVDAGSVRKTGE